MILYSYRDLQAENYFLRQEEKNSIKRIGKASALGVVGYVIVQNLMSVVLLITPLGALYARDPAVQSVVTIFLSVFSMLIPFGLCGFYLEKKTKTDVFRFDKPVSTKLMITAVLFGLFICLAGNYVTSIFVTAMSDKGVELTAPEMSLPADFAGRIIYAISIAFVPALVEEFAIRGAVMQPLRKYGDWFAIVASSIVFAVLHGNLIQAPFALIAGIGIGYAVCITESLWTGIIIHFFNNFYAVITEFMIEDITDENVLNTAYTVLLVFLYVVTIAGSVAFVILKNKRTVKKPITALTGKQKMKAFMLSIPMAIALMIMLYVTSQFVN